MKKTMIAMLALAGVAMGETVTTTYTPFSSSESWELRGLGNANGGAVDEKKPTVENNTIYAAGPNWCRPVGYYTFAAPITLSNVEDSLTFSFTLTGAVANSVATLAFEGTDGSGARTLVMGEAYRGTNGASNHNFAFGTVAANDGNAYLLGSDANWQSKNDSYNSYNPDITLLDALTANAVTFSGSIAWDEEENAFMFSLTQGNSTASFNLGNSYTLKSLNMTFDGGGTTTTFSDFTITSNIVTADAPSENIPEPATATLSLLALAGLAARRRRK